MRCNSAPDKYRNSEGRTAWLHHAGQIKHHLLKDRLALDYCVYVLAGKKKHASKAESRDRSAHIHYRFERPNPLNLLQSDFPNRQNRI